ncbi:hypothetical protein AVEN_93139-1 [Araneus ventricosus]|uniref:Uncharacterized protein n=1 Tax=Araneus ventricosus TaxID=182803 RepID=A0A4Y2IHF9_ARAVE|nr:hypothetical protein AVEN_93139-1 [Araneus ventricosus]
MRPRRPSGNVSTSGPEGRRLEAQFHRRSTVYGACMRHVVAKCPPVSVARKRGESSSSDRGSKLRGPSLNSSRVASKRDANLTKPYISFKIIKSLNKPHRIVIFCTTFSPISA